MNHPPSPPPRPLSSQGFSLAGTLCFVSLLVVVTFTLATSVVSHLNVTRRLTNSKTALSYAESAASLALGKALADGTFLGDVEYAGEGGWGRVTFSSQQANRWKIPLSVNNLNSKTSAPGTGRTLPAESLQVVSVGCCNGVTRILEQVIHLPPYRYALASTGPVKTGGGLLVAGVDDPSLLAQGVSKLKADQLKSGYVVSNDSDERAVDLSSSGRPNKIVGGVEAVGGIKLGDTTTVQGVVREHSQAAKLATFHLSDYDPKDRSDVVHIQDDQPRLDVNGILRRDGNLNLSGDLEIQSGYLFVNGNLSVQGGIRGKGALFVTGNLTVNGVSTFGADSQEALLVHGDVQIAGSDKDQAIFQGLIYTEGDLKARDVTLVGSVIANKPVAQGGSQIRLDNVNLMHNDDVVDLSYDSGFGKPDYLKSTDIFFLTSPGQSPGNKAAPVLSNNNRPLDFYDPSLDRFTMSPAGQSVELKTKVAIPGYSDVGAGTIYHFNSRDEALAVMRDVNRIEDIRPEGHMGAFTAEARGRKVDTYTEFTGKGVEEPAFLSFFQSEFDKQVEIMRTEAMPEMLDRYNELYQKHRYSWMRGDAWGFNFNPNRFLQLGDKARRLIYREWESL